MGVCSMASLEKRLFHLFERADVAKARAGAPVRVSCPRVGQVRATITDEAGESHDVMLELSAGRRGGLTLETRCTSKRGRAGKPCALLAAVFLEVDRRELFPNIKDHTPVTLDIVAADDAKSEDEPAEDLGDRADAGGDDEEKILPVRFMGSRPPVRGAPTTVTVSTPTTKRGPSRQPAWATDLEERRRLVEPAVRTRMLTIADGRRSAGALVFMLDIGASASAHAAVLVPCRMQLDVAGNASGRPRPIVLGPSHAGDTDFEQLDTVERALLAQLVGTVAGASPRARRCDPTDVGRRSTVGICARVGAGGCDEHEGPDHERDGRG